MLKKHQSLAIDVTKAENRRCILPKQPLICSYQAGWENICLEYYQQPAFESPEHYTLDYTLVIYLGCESQLQRRLGEFRKLERLKPGDVVVIPPRAIHAATTTQKSEFIILMLDADLINRVVGDGWESGVVEVTPHFAKPDPLIYQIGLALKNTLTSGTIGNHFYADSMATALAVHLLQHYSIRRQPHQECYQGLTNTKLRKVQEFILNHLTEDLLIGTIADEIGMSKYHFARLFKQSTGLSPYQYVIKCRIERAKILLSKEKRRISEVASMVGFSDQSQFSRHFKRLVGVTPQEVIRNHGRANP
ncbi:transcriptional regulator [Calothrix sp. NIES-4101]|nr:transcriptional regulator [Calothrix sp. NIES-4101]